MNVIAKLRMLKYLDIFGIFRMFVKYIVRGLDMLRRKPTRLELKAEDKEEFDEARKQAAAAAASASAATNRPSSGSVVSTLLLSDRPKLSTAQRIGLSK
ncbi:hypothetical protein O6H91_10G037200 [Diphasiastrum complanatum]|uniref:Uncharacterized protein n=2 Tax=Diphasiastrum complanatum TaxID=34168 RepID=A0ACC2CG25_DIPCM|nr:hypothetical protein O6H91_10G034900 [Diphasiastrum complanatum]KAJ7540937.1 hypothetical protein O6H91_10G037200 [Diphasiastrum complanatum]